MTDFSEGTVLRSTKGMSQYFWSLRAVTYNSRGVMILSFVFYSICPSLFVCFLKCVLLLFSHSKSLYFVLLLFQTSSFFLLFLFLLLFCFSSPLSRKHYFLNMFSPWHYPWIFDGCRPVLITTMIDIAFHKMSRIGLN